jgi:hypothetical protein
MPDFIRQQPQDGKPKHAQFSDIAQYLSSLNILEDGDKQRNWMLRLFDKHPEAIDDITKALSKKGLTQFDLIGMGARSIVLDAGHDQVVRIMLDKGVTQVAKSVKHPAILQPIAVFDVNSARRIRIEVTPKISFDNITREDELRVRDALYATNLTVPDIMDNQNVGVIEVDGKRVPLLADYSELQAARILDAPPASMLSEWLDDKKLSLQKKFDPRIGSGKIIPTEKTPDIHENAAHGPVELKPMATHINRARVDKERGDFTRGA